MAEQTTIVTEAETPEAFLADREAFWNTWKRFVVMATCAVVLIVIGLAIFVY
jgi:hypothetical protein